MQADGCRHIVTYMCQVHSGPAKYLHVRPGGAASPTIAI